MNLRLRIRISILVTFATLCVAVSVDAQQRWVGSWAASQQLVEPRNSIGADDGADVTLRQIVHLSLGGNELRLHLSNRYGIAPLHIDSVHLARAVAADSSKIAATSDQPLLFSGAADVVIPPGADYVSDPIVNASPAFADLAITIYLESVPAAQTGHPGSRATSYLVHGNQVSAMELADAKKMEHWYFISGIDVPATEDATAAVTLGDSITDGHGATTNGNDRWPDVLARRLQASVHTHSVAVLNHGIGGNRILTDSIGPSALARFDHDVLTQPGARYLLILEGINDLGMFTRAGDHSDAEHHRFVNDIVTAYHQMILRAHTRGLKVAGCTILPYMGTAFYHPGPLEEADRQAINRWIRGAGEFDAVIDFDQVTRDPASPERMLAKFDSGDHLHPSPAGYAAMANAVPLAFFTQATSSLSPGKEQKHKPAKQR